MKPLTTSVSVVLLGKFLPGFFSIESLAAANAISRVDGEEARYEVLLRDQAVEIRFSWGKLLVVPERLVAEITQVPFVRALDLALKAVREVGPGATVEKLGVNVKSQYRYISTTERDQLGARLVPPAGWGAWGREIAKSFDYPAGEPRHGGLVQVTMRQGKPDGREAGWIDAMVVAGGKSSDGFDVVINVNDHYELDSGDDVGPQPDAHVGSARLLSMLEGSFDDSVDRSHRILAGIVSGL